MKKLLVALLVASSAVPASAAILHYTLQNVALSDGGTAFGSFDVNTTSGTLTAVDVTTTAGSLFTGQHFTLSNTISPNVNLNYAFSYTAGFDGFWQAAIADPDNFLTGGTFNLDSRYAFESKNRFQTNRYAVSGLVSSDAPPAVPEPAMLGLFGLGAIGLGLSRRRQV